MQPVTCIFHRFEKGSGEVVFDFGQIPFLNVFGTAAADKEGGAFVPFCTAYGFSNLIHPFSQDLQVKTKGQLVLFFPVQILQKELPYPPVPDVGRQGFIGICS